ncbi:ABC transporter permease [Corynebacterium vitaeruminis]|uniref:Choline transport system permease protein n=1 Tax=Corynebacterium vitaeruminis DSM 20294 TaxID=1224164 RepID=W5Y2F3_9CORY|nr:ABC transporter permease subunit [Corynebacterium vitaeruminis]AHI23426.1 choline transport system permease protein [Corynebacterium vitaeruminis DSM 20294]
MDLLSSSFSWLSDVHNWTGTSGILLRLVQHLGITAVVVAVAALVALPIGIAIGHSGRGSGVVAAVAGAGRAIPTLGLLTLLGLFIGIGLLAPSIALVVLAIPPLLAGAYAGVASVDPLVVKSARAMGMTPWQQISQVELPLAWPLILGGLRSACVQVIATATLAAYTADAGLGRFIFAGLKTRDYPQMVGGAIVVVLLALLVELAFSIVPTRRAS